MNNSSVDSITFDNETGKCTHLHGECISSKCHCSPTGNTFVRIFLLERSFKTATYFSCNMRFEDKVKSEVFSKVTTVHFNGKEFKDKGTRTVTTKLSDDHNNPNDKDGNTGEVLVAVISALTVVAFILVVGIWSHRKQRHKGRKRALKKNTDEETAFTGKVMLNRLTLIIRN
ncbi:uncharacterized protein LOC127705748 [Mytilus californianus]|uniref:uncharacterized protein LOC127705748 n=1 Tax=Mytilus californianus TaxID=6549 RepID=UPI002246E21C|nr:uncharacterized protein LOC127705748 [Mytilus californianus]